MRTIRHALLLAGLPAVVATGALSAQLPATNPFAAPRPLLYEAPDFTRIRNEHFQPAIEEGMRQQLAEVAAIVAEPAPPTLANTTLPLERSGQLLARVQRAFGGLASSNTNDTLQAIQRALAPRRAAHRDAITLNDSLFQRIRSLYDRRESLGLDSLQRLVVERYYRDFVRAGALLAPADQGFPTTEYLAAALLDMAWHTLPADQPVADPDAFEAAALHRFGVDVALVPPRYRSPYFSHIWSGGYSAGYYAYIWSEVLDADAYAWFEEHGGLTRENGQRFRDLVLSRGGSGDMATIYRQFRGRDPEIEPLLRNRGLAQPPRGR